MRMKMLQNVSVVLVAACLGATVSRAQGAPPSMPAPSSDTAYVHMMSMHHDDGIKMAAVATEKASDVSVKRFAQKVRDGQQKERKELQALSQTVKGEPGHHSMKPMSLDHLEESAGREFDRMFLTMMRDHHGDAVKMSREAKLSAAAVKGFAQRTAANQEKEIKEIDALLKRIR